MTKADIATHVYEKLGFSKSESSSTVEHSFAIVKSWLTGGESLKIWAGELDREKEEGEKRKEPADRR